MSAGLKIVDVDLSYGKKSILKNLNFEILPGELACLMGANGCGKSTLLKTISGLRAPQRGQVLVNDKDIHGYAPSERACIVSIVLTERPTLPYMTVREVVALGRLPFATFWGGMGPEDRSKVEWALEVSGLMPMAQEFYDDLSDGQKQKVLVARALSQDAPVMLLDEPTTFLDLPRRMDLVLFLKDLAQKTKKAILFSTHDWELVLSMVEKTYLVDDVGRLHCGMPEDLILTGVMDRAFTTINLELDVNHGRFFPTYDELTYVVLKGDESLLHTWTEHALTKAGFRLRPEAPYTIEISDGIWFYEGPRGKGRAQSLEDLLRRLHLQKSKFDLV